MFELKCFYKDGTPVKHFTQWDVNQTIVIDGEYTKAPLVHFANKNSEYALCVQSTLESNGQISVDVPNTLLTEIHPIIIYIYQMSDNSGKTILSDEFKVVQRPQPSDYVFEENIHVVYITQLEDEIRELKDTMTTLENTMTTAINKCNTATNKANETVEKLQPYLIATKEEVIEYLGIGVI